MGRKHFFEHETWHEFEARLDALGLNPYAFCSVSGIADSMMERWQDGSRDIPLWATQWVSAMSVPEARRLMNQDRERLYIHNKLTGEHFGTVERIKR